jgi:hypothetical protein
MKFRLLEREGDLRVVLAGPRDVIKGKLIREIEADSWLGARLTIHDAEFCHDPGYGYFLTERPGAFERTIYMETRAKEEAQRIAKIIGDNVEGKRAKPKENNNGVAIRVGQPSVVDTALDRGKRTQDAKESTGRKRSLVRARASA